MPRSSGRGNLVQVHADPVEFDALPCAQTENDRVRRFLRADPRQTASVAPPAIPNNQVPKVSSRGDSSEYSYAHRLNDETRLSPRQPLVEDVEFGTSGSRLR